MFNTKKIAVLEEEVEGQNNQLAHYSDLLQYKDRVICARDQEIERQAEKIRAMKVKLDQSHLCRNLLISIIKTATVVDNYKLKEALKETLAQIKHLYKQLGYTDFEENFKNELDLLEG